MSNGAREGEVMLAIAIVLEELHVSHHNEALLDVVHPALEIRENTTLSTLLVANIMSTVLVTNYQLR